MKKPVTATKDLRFFEHPDAPFLPDAHPRRGMSAVAALGTWLVARGSWLVHVDRRRNGSWTRRYEHGTLITELRPIADDRTTGTTVHFMPVRSLMASSATARGSGLRFARNRRRRRVR
ncbi:hypothetical protein ACFUJ0_17015 [Streptomyces sp. NPDC057242]|uniref:hypothetical protein n=1 Tax=unclassified Streptomyces TaxID=2593676 RepID=UPI00362987AB